MKNTSQPNENEDGVLPHEDFARGQYVPKDPLARKCLDLSDTFIPSPEEHNCEYALTGCKGFGEGRRVRSAFLRNAWACHSCATKLDTYMPFQRLTSVEVIMVTPTWTTLEEAVERSKSEILRDVAEGTIPAACASYSELHDYVDANGYGGAFEHDFDNEETDFWNGVQDAVDAWIKAGGLR